MSNYVLHLIFSKNAGRYEERMLSILSMTEVEFIELLLEHFPWAQSPEKKAFVSKVMISLNLKDPIKRKSEIHCDTVDFCSDMCIDFIRRYASCFAAPEACYQSLQFAAEIEKQSICSHSDCHRKLRDGKCCHGGK